MNKYIKDLTFTIRMQNDFFEVSQDTPEVVCITDPLITSNSSDEDDLINRLPFTLAVELIDNNDARVHLMINLTDAIDAESNRIKDLLKESYDEGYEEGEEAGSEASYSSGYTNGYNDGQDEGEETGRREGYNEAEEEYQEKMAEIEEEHKNITIELEREIENLKEELDRKADEYKELLAKYNKLQPY